jgi:hypothetical protein
MFRAQLENARYASTTESRQVRLFAENQIPWEDLAFPVVEETLQDYFQDRARGAFPFRIGDIVRRMKTE